MKTDETDYRLQRQTPRSEQRRSAYGSLLMSVQTVQNRCDEPKCIRKLDHPGPCWPKGD